jgi:hypothetical protein
MVCLDTMTVGQVEALEKATKAAAEAGAACGEAVRQGWPEYVVDVCVGLLQAYCISELHAEEQAAKAAGYMTVTEAKA